MFNLEKIEQLKQELREKDEMIRIIQMDNRDIDSLMSKFSDQIKEIVKEIATIKEKIEPKPVVVYDKTGIELVEELRRFPIELHKCIPCRMIPYGILEDIIKKNKTDN